MATALKTQAATEETLEKPARLRPDLGSEPPKTGPRMWEKVSLSPAQMTNLGIMAASLMFGVLMWHIVTAIDLNFFINFENVPSPARVFTAFFAHVQT